MRLATYAKTILGLMLVVPGCAQGGSDSADLGGGNGGSSASGGSAESSGSPGFGGAILDPGVGDDRAASNAGDADPPERCGSNLIGTVRDFKSNHPDFQCTRQVPTPFEDPYNKDCGPWDPKIVGAIGSPIGPDRKPVYAPSSGGTISSTGRANFDQWFTDVPGVNMSQDLQLDLTESGGNYVYDSARFFPVDGVLFDDAAQNNADRGPFLDVDGRVRNFHFTYELHTTFKYEAGDVFTFRGDDDVFVYINDTLVVNLGGIHVPLQGTIDLEAKRLEVTAPMGFPDLPLDASLGYTESLAGGGVAATLPLDLVDGQVYTLDFFFAERNSSGSNFRIETNLFFVSCGSGNPK